MLHGGPRVASGTYPVEWCERLCQPPGWRATTLPRTTDHHPRSECMSYPDTRLFIDGQWQDAGDGRSLAVHNPATGQEIGRVARASTADLDRALEAAQRGFEIWRDTSAHERAATMRRAAALMRERADAIAAILTQEQGKPRL